MRILPVILAISVQAGELSAQTAACNAMIEEHFGTRPTMRLQVLTMNHNGTATSMDFILNKSPIAGAYRFLGATKQYFNDRYTKNGHLPWDQSQADNAELWGLVSPGSFNMRFRYITWNFEETLIPTCENGMIYGWGGNTYYLIKPISGTFVAPPPPSPPGN